MEKRSAFVQEIYTECKINASVDKVYAVLSDFENYAAWTSEITITGDTKPGGKMCVKVKTADDGNGWHTLSSVMKQNDRRMIAFDNVLFSPLLFLGKHRYEMVPLPDGQTLFINAEVFSGLTIPFVRKKILLGTTRRFKENVNLALKNTVEAPGG
jgi:hypothetical protein